MIPVCQYCVFEVFLLQTDGDDSGVDLLIKPLANKIIIINISQTASLFL